MPMRHCYQRWQWPNLHNQVSGGQVVPSLDHNPAVQPDNEKQDHKSKYIFGKTNQKATVKKLLRRSRNKRLTCLWAFANQDIPRMWISMKETTLQYHLAICFRQTAKYISVERTLSRRYFHIMKRSKW